MFKALSTLGFIACASWWAYVFSAKSVALTNSCLLDLAGWAWHHQPQGKFILVVFALTWFSALVLLITLMQKGLALFLGQPRVFVCVGDELLNRYQRYYLDGDPQRQVLRLPKAAGNPLKYSYPSALGSFFNRQVFLVNGDDPNLWGHASDYRVVPSIALSLMFYASFGMSVAALHALARDYMVNFERTVTPFDSVGEFIVIVAVLLGANLFWLVAQAVVYKIKLAVLDAGDLRPCYRLPFEPGDSLPVRITEEIITGNTGEGRRMLGSKAAYYAGDLETALGVTVSLVFQFGYSCKQAAAVEAFSQEVAKGGPVDCVVMDDMSVRPRALLHSGVDWFQS